MSGTPAQSKFFVLPSLKHMLSHGERTSQCSMLAALTHAYAKPHPHDSREHASQAWPVANAVQNEQRTSRGDPDTDAAVIANVILEENMSIPNVIHMKGPKCPAPSRDIPRPGQRPLILSAGSLVALYLPYCHSLLSCLPVALYLPSCRYLAQLAHLSLSSCSALTFFHSQVEISHDKVKPRQF